MQFSKRQGSGLRHWILGAMIAGGVVGTASATLLDKKVDGSLLGTAASQQFGAHLNAQADLDKDGYPDLIVGSPGGANYEGRVQVFYGSKKGPSKTPGFTYVGPMDWAQVGATPQALDVNGDGWLDLVVGASNYSGAQAYTGAVLVFFGSAAGFPSTPSQVIEGEASNSFFGFGVRSLGDFNGDGYADVLVSALGMNSPLGKLYVYTGSPKGLNNTPASTIAGAEPWWYFGRVIDTADINGDGIQDILVGMTSPTGGIPGMVWVYRGTAQGYASTRSETLFPVIHLDDTDAFGDAVKSLGDVDGDGYNDVAVGAPRHYNDFVNSGLVTIYYGSANGLAASGRTQVVQAGTSKFGNFGTNILGNRDMNGDGYKDLIVGTAAYARPLDTSKPFPGNVWIFPGSPSGIQTDRVYKLSGEKGTREELGMSLEAADLNGDGLMDLVSGSGSFTDTMANQGIVKIFRGAKKR